MDEIKAAEAQASPSYATAIGGPAAADAGTGGAATYAALSADERQTLRATLAEAHPDTIPQLIDGETVGEMVASLTTAKAAYQRAVEQANAAAPVAAGGGGRPISVDVSKLSPLAKISLGLTEK
jgi:hypothetical protein